MCSSSIEVIPNPSHQPPPKTSFDKEVERGQPIHIFECLVQVEEDSQLEPEVNGIEL